MRLTLAALALMFVTPAMAQDAGARYAAAYRATGFRLRATSVCPGSTKATVERAFASVSSSEYKTFSRAYPQTTQKWMMEGASVFNDTVMHSGIDAACQRAR